MEADIITTREDIVESKLTQRREAKQRAKATKGNSILLANRGSLLDTNLYQLLFFTANFVVLATQTQSIKKHQSWEDGPLLPLGITFCLALLLVLLIIFRQSPSMTVAIFAGCLGTLCIVLILNDLTPRMPLYS